MSDNDNQNANAPAGTQTHQEKEVVNLTPSMEKQAQDMINSGHPENVDQSVRDALVEKQNERTHTNQNVEAEQPAPEPIEEDIQVVTENADIIAGLQQSILSDNFVLTQPRLKVQLVIPLIPADDIDDIEPEEWKEQVGDDVFNFKHTLLNGKSKSGEFGILYHTLNGIFEQVDEFNSTPIYVANTDITRHAMTEIIARELAERISVDVPDELSETIVEKFEQTAGFYPMATGVPLSTEDEVSVMAFVPVPIVAASTGKLGKYLEYIEKAFGDYNADIEIILLADPIESIFNDVQRDNVRVAVEELGFEINTMEDVINAVEESEEVSFEIQDEEWSDEGELDDEDDNEDDDVDGTDEDEDEVEDEDDDSDESDSDESAFGFTLPSNMFQMSQLIRDDNSLTSLGLLVLGKKL